jgi:hypothetical protein
VATCGGDNLHQRFEPEHAARAIANQLHSQAATLRFAIDRGGHSTCAQ